MSNKIEKYLNDIDAVQAEINNLMSPIEKKLNELQSKRDELEIKMKTDIAKMAMDQLKDKDYGCGTANIDLSNHKVKVVVSKQVKWDEDKLKGIANKIRDAGQNPENFIKYKLSVSETAFKGFTEAIQNEFLPARTVEPSKPKIMLERKV